MRKFGHAKRFYVGLNDSIDEFVSRDPISALGIIWNRKNNCLAIHAEHAPVSKTLSQIEFFSI